MSTPASPATFPVAGTNKALLWSASLPWRASRYRVDDASLIEAENAFAVHAQLPGHAEQLDVPVFMSRFATRADKTKHLPFYERTPPTQRRTILYGRRSNAGPTPLPPPRPRVGGRRGAGSAGQTSSTLPRSAHGRIEPFHRRGRQFHPPERGPP
jgi:hypothetical protein